MPIPPILCISGASGSGKTTLLERLIPSLSAEGLKIGAVKRASAGLLSDPAGKDSSRLAAAGAEPTIAVSPNGLIVHSRTPLGLVDLAATYCANCDLVLAEGYRQSPHDKILFTSGDDASSQEANLASVCLVVASRMIASPEAIHRDDIDALVRWVRNWLVRRRRLREGVIGAILVGGQSRRMGADKAAMRSCGRPVLSDLAELLGGRLKEVWVVGRLLRHVDLPLFVRQHLDLRPGCGPLGGIATALRIAGAEAPAVAQEAPGGPSTPQAVLVVACDMPALSGETLDILLERRRKDKPASVLRQPATGRLEPMAAVYEPEALEGIEHALNSGALSATKLLESIGAHAIDVPSEIADNLCNVNTPEELEEIDGKR